MANMKIMKRMDGEHILSNLRHNFDAPHSVDNLRLRLSHAVNTLRCLTIPKCYPTIRCLDDEAPMQIPIDKHWERQAFCVSDLKKKSNNGNGKCLVDDMRKDHCASTSFVDYCVKQTESNAADCAESNAAAKNAPN